MTTPPSHSAPSFWRRIPIAFGAFFTALSDPAYAARIVQLDQPAPAPATEPAPAPVPVPVPTPAPKPLKEASPDAALQLLALLQREARLIDFTQENLANHADADIGAAARVVHEGCAKVLRDYFTIDTVRTEAEGSRIVLEEGFDASAVRLTGNVVGSAPFRGSLSHRGWRASSVRLPKLTETHDAAVLAPAEVEL
ncbi:DUF2760 domain-containing protein [Janthinobacterium agaricidamnosum]|uniref:DUF2760 domain-containing protein n=1 Tax=Janthinobacterium agaricidamnosum NBRC 102515 = DSM 9628 TaxID=1349767 RepID=W0V0Y1_9BURK|nr:DUF2760 domain-containing protein [Janthinobacterium agaricidamnosum]CDG82474.1 putative uncharacterized protein [Janthinobacterium agaricidamnosum NBRC 102515 = DSM 9628]